MSVREFLEFCIEYYPLTIMFGLLIGFFIFAAFVTIDLDATALEHCQENGYETSFYQYSDSQRYCVSQGQIARIQCIEHKCYIFNEQKTEESK